ncbi:MAG TPA: YajG family lipoprotein [Polyangia bacterium]|jgi:uncharacterized lipoprotein
MRVRSWVLVVVAALSIGGCALTEDTVMLTYQPRAPAQRLSEAPAVTVSVVVRDDRRGNERDRVSCKKNGYGMEMAAIRSVNDVPGLVKGSIQTELARRGFRSGPDGVTVVVELRRLYNDFHPGFFSGDATAEADLEVSVFAPRVTEGSPPVFEGRAEGEGKTENVQLSSGDNAKPALENALSEAVWRLFNNRRFVAAILSAGAAPAPAPQPLDAPQPQS